MESSSRLKCTLSLQQCELLINGYIKNVDDQMYKNDDPEVVVKHYSQFLCACAQYTRRLNSSVVEQAIISILGVRVGVAKKKWQHHVHGFEILQ